MVTWVRAAEVVERITALAVIAENSPEAATLIWVVVDTGATRPTIAVDSICHLFPVREVAERNEQLSWGR